MAELPFRVTLRNTHNQAIMYKIRKREVRRENITSKVVAKIRIRTRAAGVEGRELGVEAQGRLNETQESYEGSSCHPQERLVYSNNSEVEKLGVNRHDILGIGTCIREP